LNTAPWNTIKISCALFSHNLSWKGTLSSSFTT